MNIRLINKYLLLDPVGPVIDGNMVLQGSVPGSLSPVICIIEFAADHDESFRVIGRVMPWDMIFSTNDNSEEIDPTFVIPIALGEDFTDGTVRISVLVADMTTVPYDEQVDSFNPDSESFIPALLFCNRVRGDNSADKPQGQSDQQALVVVHACIASGQKEKELRESEGYEMSTVMISADGVSQADSSSWPFFIGAAYAPYSEGLDCVEDVFFVQSDTKGVIPQVPVGFEVIGDITQSDAAVLNSTYIFVY